MLFEKALQGFLLYQRVSNHSPLTLTWYQQRLNVLEKFLRAKSPQPQIEQVTKQDLIGFIQALQTRETIWGTDKYHKPQERKLSVFTCESYHRALAAFFNWCHREEVIPANIMQGVPRPKLPKPIKPRLTEEEIKNLLGVCAKGSKALAARNRGLILLLLDSGARANEICTLDVKELDPRLDRIRVHGKGAKDRFIFVSNKTKQAIWQYLRYRPEPQRENYLFLTPQGNPLTAIGLHHTLTRLGRKAGIEFCGPHRFRRTMATLSIKNGMDLASLQSILGHSNITTTRVYLSLEPEDIAQIHQRTSPVDRLGV